MGEDEGQSQKIGQGYGGEADQALRRAQTPPGYAFSPDTPWQAEFEENFAYVETDDQLRCIAEIKQDMQQSTPMDRLLCGDVGFGKTEVALRAAMNAILDSKQVAILSRRRSWPGSII